MHKSLPFTPHTPWCSSPPDREMILDKKLTVDRVATRIIEEYEDFLNIMFSDENAQNLVLRIR